MNGALGSSNEVECVQCEHVQCGVCAVWGVCSVGRVQSGVCAVWGVCSVECVQCGVCAVWSVCSVGRVQCGVCAVWGVCSVEFVQCNYLTQDNSSPVASSILGGKLLSYWTNEQ